jgi:hypothetical protein
MNTIFAQALSGVNIPRVEASETNLQKGISLMLQLAAILAVVYIMIGAVRFTVSNGDSGKIANARKTVIYALVGLGLAVSGLVITAYIRTIGERVAVSGGDNPFFGQNGILTILVEQLAFAVGAASVIMIIIGGLRYITSAGQSQSAQAARNTVQYAVVGLLVAAGAKFMVAFLLERL